MRVERLDLDVSDVVIQVRADGTSCVARSDELPGLLARPDSVGSIWHPPLPANAMIGIHEHTPGDVAGKSWWVIYGNAELDVHVAVTLDDGTTPTVHRIGNIWACEWVSLPQQAAIRRSDHLDDRFTFRFFRPAYLPQAPYPHNAC